MQNLLQKKKKCNLGFIYYIIIILHHHFVRFENESVIVSSDTGFNSQINKKAKLMNQDFLYVWKTNIRIVQKAQQKVMGFTVFHYSVKRPFVCACYTHRQMVFSSPWSITIIAWKTGTNCIWLFARKNRP